MAPSIRISAKTRAPSVIEPLSRHLKQLSTAEIDRRLENGLPLVEVAFDVERASEIQRKLQGIVTVLRTFDIEPEIEVGDPWPPGRVEFGELSRMIERETRRAAVKRSKMSGKVVRRRIKARVWPVLRELGFTDLTDRQAFRYDGERIDVLEVNMAGPRADILTETSFSFWVDVGCTFADMPVLFDRVKKRKGRWRPDEPQCYFRGQLEGSWQVDPSGALLDDLVEDLAVAVREQAAPWFAQFADRAALLARAAEPVHPRLPNWPQPLDDLFIGYTARALGKPERALKHLEVALASGRYDHARAQLEADIATLRIAVAAPLSV